MKVLNSRLGRCIASSLVALMVMPAGRAATMQLRRSPELDRAVLPNGHQTRLLDQKKILVAEITPYDVDAMFQQTPDQSRPVVPDKGTASQQQNAPSTPVGTAAAPYEKPEGAPASRPAGAAIAPAKQRRVKSFAIRTALLVGAGVAIGVVAAASLGSSSRPH